MAVSHVQDVLDFLLENGFARAASALRDDVLARGDEDLDLGGSPPPPPPVRIVSGHRDGQGGGGASSSSTSGSSDAFLSMGSSPSELRNPYGLWSSSHAESDDSSDRHSEFGTAREYNDPNLFNDTYWYDDRFGSYVNDLSFGPTNSGGCPSEDKFVMSIEAEEQFGKENNPSFDLGEFYSETSISCADKPVHSVHAGCEYNSSFPLCDCCNGLKGHHNGGAVEQVRNSNSSIYGRYQIMPDNMERLDECEDVGFQLKLVDESSEAVVFEGGSLHDPILERMGNNLESPFVEKEVQVLNSAAVDGNTFTNCDPVYERKSSGSSDYCVKACFVKNMDNEYPEDYDLHLFSEKGSQPVANDAYESGQCGTEVGEFQDHGAVGVEGEGHGIIDELQDYISHEDEYEIFDLRIIHRKNRTGFEESKDLPIVLKSVIAGRYYVTEYLGSAAFSNVIQAHDLQTGIDVCLKIIKNDKDFFDQSLDEIKLLKFVNKHDPADERHILRLYDYFYHQEHLFIVCELLRANLYEFQKYSQDSGGEVYFTLPRLQVIARQCLEALEYLHQLGIIHCDLKPENILIKSYSSCEIKVIDLGSSCFQTDNLCLYVQSRSYRAPEVILGLSYDQKIDIWSLGCILAELYSGDVLFPNDSVATMLARIIGILGPIDMEMLATGQETHKYFTDDYDLYFRNEETSQVECLIPEKSSLARHLRVYDAIFLEFLEDLLQINPQRRPTARQALQHQWLSFSYQ